MVRMITSLSVCVLLLSACASEQEKKARGENAFDLQGEYTARKAKDSEVDLDISITNEGSRSNVLVKVTRPSPQEVVETNFLKAHNLDPQKVASHFASPIVLGAGNNNSLSGGENISVDFGESSQVTVCTPEFQYDATHQLTYCLSGKVTRTDFTLRGSWSLNLVTKIPKKNDKGEDETKHESHQVTMKFAGITSNTYFDQVYGVWSGKVSLGWVESLDLKGDNLLTIRKLNNNEFEVVPAQEQIAVNGQAYRYVPQRYSIKATREMEVPVIEVLYKNVAPENTSDRVVLFAQIYSLGKLTGSVIHINGTAEDQIASFTLVRK